MVRNSSVIGIYQDRTAASDAIDVLHKAGYRPADIAVLSSENQGSKDFACVRRTRAPAGAAFGAVVGAVTGAAIAWFLSTSEVRVAGIMPLVAAGPVLAALIGAGAGGALGWLLGLLAGLQESEYIARRYAGRVRHGGILVSVHCDDGVWCDRAKRTLRDTGARDISSAAEAKADFGTTDKPSGRVPSATTNRVPFPPAQPTDSLPYEVRDRN